METFLSIYFNIYIIGALHCSLLGEIHLIKRFDRNIKSQYSSSSELLQYWLVYYSTEHIEREFTMGHSLTLALARYFDLG